MGCIPSSCWRTSQQESNVSMQGVVMEEFGRWKSSIEVLVRFFWTSLNCRQSTKPQCTGEASAQGLKGKAFCLQEKEAKKEAKKDKKRQKIKNKEEDAGSSPAERAGLAGSYKDLKNMLFRSSGSSPGPGEHPSTNGISAGEDSSVSREVRTCCSVIL